MTTPQEDLPDLDALQRQWQQLQAANADEIQAIAALGAMVDPRSLNRLRIDTLVSFIFARLGNVSTEVRQTLTYLFEIEFEQAVAESLKEIKSDVRKAALGMGAEVSPAALRRMWMDQQKGNGGPGGLIQP